MSARVIMTMVKICGITQSVDALQAVSCGADMLGFIQYPKSPRYVSPAVARTIIDQLPEGVRTVGVFVNETAAVIRSLVAIAGFDVIQLHGDERPSILDDLDGFEVIKALSLAAPEDLNKADQWPNQTLLVDTPCAEYGGSGEVGDWSLAARLAETRSIILAGGLAPENVARAIGLVKPFGVDVSSGVERSNGVKDSVKVRAFLARVRSTEDVT